MNKYITTLVMAFLLFVTMHIASAPASAQTRSVRRTSHTRYYYKKPNFYRRHRKAINIGGGTAAGMLVGGLIGGRKGVLIGGLRRCRRRCAVYTCTEAKEPLHAAYEFAGIELCNY